MKNLKKQDIQDILFKKILFKKKLDKTCFQHVMAYVDFKDLPKRTASEKVLLDQVFNIAKNTKYDGYERDLASMRYKSFNKTYTAGTVTRLNKSAIKSKNILNELAEELAEELRKTINKKFEKRKVNSSFKDNIWGAVLADMNLISRFNEVTFLLLCVIDMFSKYAWVFPLVVNSFQETLDKFGRKPDTNQIRYFTIFLKSWLRNNNKEMYLARTKEIKTLKTKIYKDIITKPSKHLLVFKTS